MMGYEFDFGAVAYYGPALMAGASVTLQLTALACVIGTLLGIPLAALLLTRGLVGIISSAIVDFIRAIPDLVLFFFFYFFPYREFLDIAPPSPFLCATLAMSLILAVFTGEVVRDAVTQVPRVQILGLQALGFKRASILRHVYLPALSRSVLPALIAFWIGILKMSSLASIIGVNDVVYVAKVSAAQNFRTLEAWITVAFVYACLVIPTVMFLRMLQRSDWMRRQ